MRKKILYWLPFLALGPITGPLTEGVLRNWRRGDRVLAGLYVLAIPSSLALLAACATASII